MKTRPTSIFCLLLLILTFSVANQAAIQPEDHGLPQNTHCFNGSSLHSQQSGNQSLTLSQLPHRTIIATAVNFYWKETDINEKIVASLHASEIYTADNKVHPQIVCSKGIDKVELKPTSLMGLTLINDSTTENPKLIFRQFGIAESNDDVVFRSENSSLFNLNKNYSFEANLKKYGIESQFLQTGRNQYKLIEERKQGHTTVRIETEFVSI